MAEEDVPNRTRLSPEEIVRVHVARAEAWAAVGIAVAKWAGVGVSAYFGYLSIEALAGEVTIADLRVIVEFLGDIRITVLAAWLVGAGGVGYGFWQNKLRKNTIERLQGRIQQLERRLNPDRTSSNLTPRGETRPEDEL